ncbi:hypothetical protein MKZ38_005409 [Zalerion maritima]|uniref:Zn(2)-C6 fungal-type domain-containing protein n=1 Tax=Zalerion maritima TaxID=339359 RepID=A0AAD5RKQ1_9PEZI|nr:hypothetical protein MKZ38_005409 [Zalerion maritima]
MTRPKVDPDKRQRTAQACDSCKRRKQKCNGLKPCNTCTRRNLECSYTSNHPEHGPGSPPKRRHIEPPPASTPRASTVEVLPISAWAKAESSGETKDLEMKGTVPMASPSTGVPDLDAPKPISGGLPQEPDFDGRSRNSTISGQDEEAAVYTSPRMLQDSTGRLLYVGDSATLSYLQLIRMIVESIAGQSPFTMDPRRHRIIESTISFPSNIRPPHLLPDRQTADVLTESYFINTSGLLEVFDRRQFTAAVDACYTDPLSVESPFLCLLYLTFAIGLVFITPLPGTREDAVAKKLRSEQFDRAELFFRSAKCLADPVSGFEDADFWSVQALLLMAVYMLSVSKRNAAYAYYGMAVRSAFALGLHREETMVIFSADELAVRRNLWRSLFVLDRFLSASLGRPAAISEDDCSGDALKTPERSGGLTGGLTGAAAAVANFATASLTPSSSTVGLDAAVRSCHVIGEILKKVYSKRKISTRVAQEIADRHKCWPTALHPSLHWKQAMNRGISASQGIAILHVNLLYCHSIILLTRPFFLYLLTKVERERANGGHPAPRISSRMEKFSEACVQASYHTIVLVQIAFEGTYLPQRNPFVLYFLFAATLIVLSNEFALLYHNASYGICVANAVSIMRHCSESDPQAERLLYILTTFRDVVMTRTSAAAASASALGAVPQAPPHIPGMSPAGPTGMASPAPSANAESGMLHHRVMPTISASPGATFDPMASFFTSSHGHHHHEHAMRPHQAPAHVPREASSASPANAGGGIPHHQQASTPTPTGGVGTPGSMQPPPKPDAPPHLSTAMGNGMDGMSPASQPAGLHRVSTPIGDDGLPSAEAEFDFDSLWNWPGDVTGAGAGQQQGARFAATAASAAAAAAAPPGDAFAGLGAPGSGGAPQGGSGLAAGTAGIGLGGSIPLYQMTDFS